jgi:hypothetical protein
MILVKTFPLLASAAPFFRLIVLHFECPDIALSRNYLIENVELKNIIFANEKQGNFWPK